MTDADKISFVDRILEMIPKSGSDEVPVMIGTLNRVQGINGFIDAEVGHPVFELKDRYIIYLECKTPEMVSKHGQPKQFIYFKVAIPYYKQTLAPLIEFNVNIIQENPPKP